MTPPPTILAGVMDSAWFRDARRRRLTFLVVAAVLAILCVWPRRYEAQADLKPSDSSGGLSSLLSGGGGLAGLGALLGGHDSIESDLAIARSHAALTNALNRLSASDRRRLGSADAAEVRLRKKVDVAALRGSILQITVRDGDRDFARTLVAAYAAAIQDRLANVSLTQAVQRKAVAVNRLGEAATRLARAQAALAQFRSAHRLAAPELQLGSAVSVLAGLQAKLQADTVALQTARQFATPDNVQIQALEAEIAGLRTQIDQAETSSRAAGTPTLGDMSDQTAEYLNLFREDKIATTLSELYTEALEQITVDELSANATANLVEPPFIVPERQFNTLFVGLLLLVVLSACACEFYALSPPVGRR
jgi:uncharacterized protein involved in exopolysaccharide biosynthesis